MLVESQLNNVRRSIAQLYAGVMNVQKMEADIKSRFNNLKLSEEVSLPLLEEGPQAQPKVDQVIMNFFSY